MKNTDIAEILLNICIEF